MAGQPVGSSDSTRPMFSLVVPVYNVEPFLPAFLDSLARQSVPHEDCELIFVNDGSTDGSADLIRAWIARTGTPAEIVDQPNHGLSAARNAGLERATGRWVSFPDPDDVLDPQYLRAVREFIASRTVPGDLVCTRLMILDDGTGEITDTHPLHRRFDAGTRVVNLEGSPEVIHLSAATGFYQRAVIERLGLRFDPSIRPNFEDASFTALYLSSSTPPRLGIVADARYRYRKRADASSLVQGGWAREERYTTVPERGYLALLRQLERRLGTVPVWAQNLVLYDLLFYFRQDQSTTSPTARVPPAWTDRFHELAEEILRLIDVETIDAFAVMPTSRQLKAALIIGYKRERTVPGSLRLASLDGDQRLVAIRYFCGSPPPAEELWLDGRADRPAYAKTRDIFYLGRLLLHERILWVPAMKEIRVAINGRRMPLELGTDPALVDAATPELIWRRLLDRPPPSPGVPDPPGTSPAVTTGHRVRAAIRARFPGAVRAFRRLRPRAPAGATRRGQLKTSPFAGLDPRQDARIRGDATSNAVRRRYAGAWTFMDRDTEAHDNAEHLYRYVRRHHPEVNAWFVLRRESRDWSRLANEGFRLVPYGSADHVHLLLNTDHLVSSQADNYVARPLDAARFGKKSWRFTFLQHGVTKDDLSRWFNTMPIDRFITASPAEHESIVADHTPYVFTDKEVRLTGFPRHDRLLELGRRADRADLILVMPTWRSWLLARLTNSNARDLVVPLETSAFWQSWTDLLGSPELKAIAEQARLAIAFVPHPTMQNHLAPSDVPQWVSLHSYETSDVQELLARAAVTVTDYSSQAFESAYLERPVVYYQFDRDEFFSGAHVYRKGTWDYETDGFGPVTLTRAEALDAIRDAVARGEPADSFLARMRAAFSHRDGRCCERTFASIIALTTPVADEEAVRVADGELLPRP